MTGDYKHVCVFSASSDEVAAVHTEHAAELGGLLAANGWGLVFGGGTRGLMGAVARGVHDRGGHVIGIIPDKLNRPGVTYETCDELIVTDTLRERKFEMDRRADAFVALPGGFGTLEELLEAITLKQLHYHSRPVVMLNTDGFYDGLVSFMDSQIQRGFVKPSHRDLFWVADSPTEAVEYLKSYEPVVPEGKLTGIDLR